MTGDLAFGGFRLTGLSLGTVGSPAVQFTGDTNTGIYSSAADTVDVSSGGVRAASFATVATGVNYFLFTPSATTANISLDAEGTDTNIGINYDTKGTGAHLWRRAGGTTEDMRLTSGLLLLGDTANANMTTGLTINQGAADNQAFALKSSDVITNLTTATITQDVETDDYCTVSKGSAAVGGFILQGLAEDDVALASSIYIQGYGGVGQTTDTTANQGLVAIFAAEHDGANGLRNAPADQNLFSIASWSAGAYTARLILKGDDGELHLGNTTLVALDTEDDPQYVRALIMERTRGDGVIPDPYYKPTYDYEALKRIGVVGEKDRRGEYLIRVQSYLGLHDMAIWQLYVSQRRIAERIAAMEEKFLEA